MGREDTSNGDEKPFNMLMRNNFKSLYQSPKAMNVGMNPLLNFNNTVTGSFGGATAGLKTNNILDVHRSAENFGRDSVQSSHKRMNAN